MKRALIVIDYTYDFVADNGKLTCGKPGQLIESYIVDTVRNFVEDNEFVVMAVDVHDEWDEFHPEARLYPPHNLRGTSGRELYGALNPYFNEIRQSRANRVEWLDKTRYSAFAGTNLHLLLSARGIHEIHLVGVCTDICVLHTAVDAYNYGYKIYIHENGVASFNPTGHDFAINHFRTVLGAHIV